LRRLNLTSIPNMSSLVDVTLMLLAIFMITSSVTVDSGLDVSLPKTSAARSKEYSGEMITIKKDGTIYIGYKKVTLEEFPRVVKSMHDAGKLSRVALKADRSVPYETVIKVIGYIRETGLDELGLVALPEERR